MSKELQQKALEFVEQHKRLIGHTSNAGILCEVAIGLEDAIKAVSIASELPDLSDLYLEYKEAATESRQQNNITEITVYHSVMEFMKNLVEIEVITLNNIK